MHFTITLSAVSFYGKNNKFFKLYHKTTHLTVHTLKDNTKAYCFLTLIIKIKILNTCYKQRWARVTVI